MHKDATDFTCILFYVIFGGYREEIDKELIAKCMFEAVWDTSRNTVILVENAPEADVVYPRPVFFEELDLLGFAKHWNYPRSEEPLLWAIGRDYYYKGVMVAQVTGGDFFNPPNVAIIHSGSLEPIDLSYTIEKNVQALNVVIGESLEFIRRVQKNNDNDLSQLTVAFSGGKDSQVVLDLVSRVVNPDQYIVVYTDTGMEIPFVEETIDYTVNHYRSKYPSFKFYTAKPKRDIDELWNFFGPPSQKIRWCCSVCKSVPFVQKMRELIGSKKLNHTVVFEGVRAEESSRRNKYQRLAVDVKHINLTNARPIFEWSTTQVFLYLIYRNITINRAYRYGMLRVGCSVCPYASKPANFYLNALFPDQTSKFVSHIRKLATGRGMSDPDKINDYISDRLWAARSGGIGINNFDVSNDVVISEDCYKVIIRNPRENILSWLKTLGPISVMKDDKSYIVEVLVLGIYLKMKIEMFEDKTILTTLNVNEYPVIRGYLTKLVNKATYCVQCGLCEVECPQQAIHLYPSVKITDNCVHCHKCITSIDKGCLIAQSLHLPTGGNKMKKNATGLDRYKKFGMRDIWLKSFLSNPHNWFENNTLGADQIPAFKRWLKDSELLSATNAATELTKLFMEIEDFDLIWQVIWVNLCNNSPIVHWYLSLPLDRPYTKNELVELLSLSYPTMAKSTLNNPLSALLNTFDNTPLGNSFMIGCLVKKGRAVDLVTRRRIVDCKSASIAYSLYRYAELNNKRYLTIRELMDKDIGGGPIKCFGMTDSTLVEYLRGIQEYDSNIIKIDYVANLDNVNLNQEFSSIDVLRMMLRKDGQK